MCCVITEGVRFHCIFLETSKYATGSTFRCAAMLLNFYASKINIYVWCMYGIDYCVRFEGEIVVDIQSLLLEKVSQLKHNNRYLLMHKNHRNWPHRRTQHSTAQHNCCKIQDFICTCDGKIFTVGDIGNGTAPDFAEITQFLRCTNFF